MIESNVIEWLDFGDSTQKIDIYSKSYLEFYFKFLRTLLKSKTFPILVDIILMIISFLQLLCLSAIVLSSENDIIIQILQYLKIVFIPSEIVTNNNLYFQLFFSVCIIILLDIILIFIILLKILKLKIFLTIINLINILIYYYLIGPVIVICHLCFWCEDGQQKFLNVECFSNSTHLEYIVFSILICLFYILIAILYSIYCNEIGSLTTNINEKIIRVNCNYELFNLIYRIIIFIIYYFLKTKNNNIFILVFEGFIFIINAIISIYVYKYLYYYNSIINYINYYGWCFCSWFSLCAFLKILFKLFDITIFIIIGWIIIFLIVYKMHNMEQYLLITNSDFLKFKNIKSIEMFNNYLLQILANRNKIKSKILLYGIIKNFEEIVINYPELNFHYNKLLNDKFLSHKYNKNDELPILSIIYILYLIQLEKANNKEICLYMCYFLINRFKNTTFAIFICSKSKLTKHINLYYKYLLSEDIKEQVLYEISKKMNNESIKYIEVGSIILYNLYKELFNLKIYDAISNQIDYFDILKSNISTEKTTNHFLKIGNSILKIRNEIIIIWSKLIQINPFSDEIYKDYILYLDSIIKDDILYKEESNKYMLIKNEKIEKKYNIYHSMFSVDKSSIVLIDGYLSNGKILYTSPNFPILFSYSGNELLNNNIDELLPNVIQNIHKELVINAVKYSKIKYIFKAQNNSLIKIKNERLFNIKLFVKPVPNLRYGLVYYSYLQKIDDSNFIIVLDKDLKISGFADMTKEEATYPSGGKYNLNHLMYGYHIGLLIPEILTLLNYKNGEFNIIKKNIELKGYLYSINKMEEIKSTVEIIDKILEKIKNNNINDDQNQSEEIFQIINKEYSELAKLLNNDNYKSYSIFYKIKMYTFLEGKFKYYRIYINDDIITSNEGRLKQRINNEESNISKNNNSKYIFRTSKISSQINKDFKDFKKKTHIKKSKKKKKSDIYDTNFNNVLNNFEDINNNGNAEDIKESNEYNDNNEIRKLEKFNKINNRATSLDSSSNIDNRFNKLRLEIMNRKEIVPIKIMKYLCILYVVVINILMIIHEKTTENSFSTLSTFLDENIFFNMSKISVAVLYITSINIKWQLHSCNISTDYNLTDLYQDMLSSNIDYLTWIKNFINNLGKEYDDMLLEKHDIELSVYGTNEKNKYRFDYDNMLTFFINSEINLLAQYPTFLTQLESKQSLDPLTIGLNELEDLSENTYLFFKTGLNGFQKDDKEKKINKIFNTFPFLFICSVIILLIILIICNIYTYRLNDIEIYLLNKLLHFNSNSFDNYIKHLDEIKKKLAIDNGEKEDLDISEESSKKEQDEKKNTQKHKNRQSLKKEANNKNKTQTKKKDKLTIMKSFFIKNNLFFGIKILFIYLISLTYYVISLLIEKKQKNEFLTFDTVNDSIIGFFKESYDIFIILKRELEIYEKNLTFCKIDSNKNEYKMNLPPITDIKSQNLGNFVLLITSSSGFTGETIANLTEFISGDTCQLISSNEEELSVCNSFWNGIMTEGMEQTLIKTGDIIRVIIEELNSINTGGRSFSEIVASSSFILYELFIEYYYQKSYRYIEDIFWALRNQKISSIFTILRTILIIYIVLSFLLFIFFLYFIISTKKLFNSFLNFICILPSKYLYEDHIFYKEILQLENDYF